MSQTLKFADNTTYSDLQLVTSNLTAFADGLDRNAIQFQFLASSHTVEDVKTTLSNKVKTQTMYIINGETTSSAYTNYTIIAGGISLQTIITDVTIGTKEDRIIVTMAKETNEEISNDKQEADIKTLLMNTEMDFSLLKQKVAALEAK